MRPRARFDTLRRQSSVKIHGAEGTLRIAEFLITSTYAGFIVLFLLVAVRAIRSRGRANLDALFFFSVLAALSIVGLVEGPLRTGATGASEDLRRVLALALPVLLLRLLDGFTPVSARVFRIAIVGYALSLPVVLAMSSGMRVLLLVPALYFLGTLAYAAIGFARFAGSTSGVTRHRMQAVGAGTLLLMVAGLISVVAEFAKVRGGLSVEGIASVVSFATGVAYYVGIAPPATLRRIWQYAALTDVLRLLAVTPASMPIEASTPILNRGIAAAFGAPHVAIMVWDESQQALVSPGERLALYPDYHPDTSLVTHVFQTQRADYFENAPSLDPANAALYRRMSAYSVLVAPIRTASGSVGVLTLFSSRAALFSCDDVPFVETVAEQLAAFFVRHELVQQAVAVEAQAEAMRLKEDFLAAAAHDLRTPLTGILGRAQLLLRRAEREPGSARRIDDLRSLVEDGKRMQRLTEGLLEVSRLEHGFSADLVLTDLRALVMDTVHGSVHRDHRIVVDGHASAMVDAERFRQVVQNLVDNAVKFSPGRVAISVQLEEDAETARVSVVDSGVGVAEDEVDSIFDRFQRGSAATRGLMGGMGVGLYLCRRIVEEHGGTIRAERRVEGGSRFVVELPAPTLVPPPPAGDFDPSTEAVDRDSPPAGDVALPLLAPSP